MLATMVGNQHGVSFSQEVGMARKGNDVDDDSEGSDTPVVLEGSQVRGTRATIGIAISGCN